MEKSESQSFDVDVTKRPVNQFTGRPVSENSIRRQYSALSLQLSSVSWESGKGGNPFLIT